MTLTIDRLSVTYRDGNHSLLALDQIDLSLGPGRITALVGESGSGKTTLGKTIMGILPENAKISGSVNMDGKDLTDLDEKGFNQIRWSKVAMVFQNGAANLDPVLRVIDQVAEPLIQHGRMDRSVARSMAKKRLELMGLDPEKGLSFPHELSGGEVQRALLAMAMIMDPELLILDEPTSALDPMTKAFVARVIKGLRKQGASVLLITHDLDLAGSLADDLAVIYLGRVMETMPAKDLLLRPSHPYSLALGRSYPGMDALRDLGGIRGDAFYRVLHAHETGGEEGHSHTHVAAPGSIHEDGHAPVRGCLFQPRCTQAIEECRVKDVPMISAGDHQVRCLRGGIVDLLELHGVEKRYGPVTALRSTDLTLKAGEVFCLVGETGSGKTTLAMIAAGVLHPDRGSRVFEGRDMDQWRGQGYRSLARRIGVIYQNPAEAVSHRLSVFDIVAEPLRIQGNGLAKEEIQERVKGVLADVRLSTEPEFLRRYPHELNMGAVQRLCIARALILGPSLLVADEPTSSLDPSVQAKVLKLLLDLQIEKGLTMLFVTHDMGLARKIGDRIGVMLAGTMVERGPSARVLKRPLHPYTRLLMESARGIAGELSRDTGKGHETGCPFAQRCGHAVPQCLTGVPPETGLDGGHHLVRCFRPQMEAGG